MGNHRPAPPSELRLDRSQRRPRFRPRVPVKAAGQTRVEKGAVCCPQAGDKLWRGPYRRDGSGRKPSVGDAGDPSMESTSGTADLGALRGATGDAAPWALVVGLREQANHRTVPDVVGARSRERVCAEVVWFAGASCEQRARRRGRSARAGRTGARRSWASGSLAIRRSRVCAVGLFGHDPASAGHVIGGIGLSSRHRPGLAT